MEILTSQQGSEILKQRDRKRQAKSNLGTWALNVAAYGVIAVIAFVIATVVVKGLPSINWEFLTQHPLEGMKSGGIWPMIRGSLLLMSGTLLIALPVGILGGIFMAEYVGQSRIASILRACLISLAGTPSIVFGLFGLAVFVLTFKIGVSLLAGWLTLSLYAIPVVIITTETAMRAVPASLTESGLSLGLSRWQTLAKISLPHAMPSIATGVVLSTGRAAGEAPPILLTAAVYFSTGQLTLSWDTLKQPVANLPYHLAEGYRQGGVIPEKTIWGTCFVLMMLVLLINLVAILVRARARLREIS